MGVKVLLWGETCDMKAGIYQVCHRRAHDGEFQTTGLSLTLQDIVSSATINDMAMGGGHRLAAPKVATNRFFFAAVDSSTRTLQPWNFIALPGDRSSDSSRYGAAWDKAEMFLSIIPAMADCADATENPAASAAVQILGQAHMPKAVYDNVWGMGQGKSGVVTLRASGHLTTRVQVAYDSGANDTEPLGVWLDEAVLWGGMSNLATGSYQICVCVQQKPTSGVKKFNATGIALKIHAEVEAIWVNYLNPNGGVRVIAPKAVGNRVVFVGDRFSDQMAGLEGQGGGWSCL